MPTAQSPYAGDQPARGVDDAPRNNAAGRDKRKYKRRKLNAEVRFTAKNNIESKGRLHDISEGGLYMECDLDLDIGDDVIAYPEGLGRVEGTVVRKDAEGLAIQFSITDVQREYLAKRIESAQAGAPYLRLVERRKHERTPLNLEVTACVIESGALFPCTMLDISQSGAAIRAEERPPLGSTVKIGMLQGAVDRHTDIGFIIVFSNSSEQ